MYLRLSMSWWKHNSMRKSRFFRVIMAVNLLMNNQEVFLKKTGVVHQSSCLDTPQQNGITERNNRHFLKVMRALMCTSKVPQHLWGEALVTATYLINRMSSRDSQRKYVLDLLKETRMCGCRPAETPIDPNLKLVIGRKID